MDHVCARHEPIVLKSGKTRALFSVDGYKVIPPQPGFDGNPPCRLPSKPQPKIKYLFVDSLSSKKHPSFPSLIVSTAPAHVYFDKFYLTPLFHSNLLYNWYAVNAVSVAADAKLSCCALTNDSKFLVAGDESGAVHFLRLENYPSPEPPFPPPIVSSPRVPFSGEMP